jgi:hypothetical protein
MCKFAVPAYDHHHGHTKQAVHHTQLLLCHAAKQFVRLYCIRLWRSYLLLLLLIHHPACHSRHSP